MQQDQPPNHKGRSMGETKENCTWISFYQELANALLPYRDDRRALIEKLQAVYANLGMKIPKLDSTVTPADIDPYTIFGLFNKRISNVSREKIIARLAEEFNIDADSRPTSTASPSSTTSTQPSTLSLATEGAANTTSTTSGAYSKRESHSPTTRTTRTAAPSSKR